MPFKLFYSFLDSLFTNQKVDIQTPKQLPSIIVDVHAHILPNVDDGPSSVEESIEIIEELYDMGYRKLILTPHIMSVYYKNTTESILKAFDKLQCIIKQRRINIRLEAAAEYYLEENLFTLIEKQDILSFGGEKKYLLFEASFVTPFAYLLESVIKIKQAGYTPVLAHPERYINLNNLDLIKRLAQQGVLFQINLGSLSGYYSKQSKELAELLIQHQFVSFLGSDCHSLLQLQSIKQTFKLDIMTQIHRLNLLNNSLLTVNEVVYA